MANGTSTPVLTAVPRPTDIGSEIRSAYNARENLRALIARVRAARAKVDTDLTASTIRDFGGPRPDGADLAVKRVDDASRERTRLETQESALQILEMLVTYRLDLIRRESPGAIIAELQRRRAELERQLATEQADVAAIKAQLDLVDEELRKFGAGGDDAVRPARASRRKASRAEAEPTDTAAGELTAALAASVTPDAASAPTAIEARSPRRSRNGRAAGRSPRGRRR